MQRLRDPGVRGATSSRRNGARTTPNSEMLAAPSRNAVQILGAGPGRSSAAITSQRISSAGAMAAVPMTVGREARRFIGMADMAIFLRYLRLKPGCARNLARKCRQSAADLPCGALSAQQPRQMPLIRSFMMASSALIVSTYFELSVLGGAPCARPAAPRPAALRVTCPCHSRRASRRNRRSICSWGFGQ